MKLTTLFCAVAVTLVACGQASSPNPTAPSNATVTAIVVTSASASSATFQLTATARMSDGTNRDVTTLATWQSSNTLIAAVSPTGLVTVVSAGELDVRATYQSVVGTLHLLVTKVPAASIAIIGAPTTAFVSFQLRASGQFTDGTTEDITQAATWQSSNTQVATVSTTGYVTVVSNGAVDLTASYQGLTASTHVTIMVPATYTLSGGVYDMATGRPIPGARVELVGGSGGFTTTDASGAFSMAVPNGRNLVEASKDGYQPNEQTITVSGNTTLTIPLTPSQ